MRTCLLCGEQEEKENLLRLVVRDGIVIVDHAFREPGRGGYLHREECMTKASLHSGERTASAPFLSARLSTRMAKRWTRAFRTRVTPEMVASVLSSVWGKNGILMGSEVKERSEQKDS